MGKAFPHTGSVLSPTKGMRRPRRVGRRPLRPPGRRLRRIHDPHGDRRAIAARATQYAEHVQTLLSVAHYRMFNRLGQINAALIFDVQQSCIGVFSTTKVGAKNRYLSLRLVGSWKKAARVSQQICSTFASSTLNQVDLRKQPVEPPTNFRAIFKIRQG
jgi:hypothetical protein